MKICNYTYAGKQEYSTSCGKIITAEQIRMIDKKNERFCLRCGKAIVWNDLMEFKGRKEGRL